MPPKKICGCPSGTFWLSTQRKCLPTAGTFLKKTEKNCSPPWHVYAARHFDVTPTGTFFSTEPVNRHAKLAIRPFYRFGCRQTYFSLVWLTFEVHFSEENAPTVLHRGLPAGILVRGHKMDMPPRHFFKCFHNSVAPRLTLHPQVKVCYAFVLPHRRCWVKHYRRAN